MKEWTQTEIDELLACPKRITTNPRRQMSSERGSRRNGMELESTDGRHRFRAFMRINEAFPENFSIGLDYVAEEPGGGFCLMRCNGPHEGPAGTGPQPPSHHAGYHVHRARADNLDQGLRAERGAETTKDYGSYGEALRHFLKACNIQSAEAHFKDDLEKSLFDEADHGG